jgi:hypothetical protein
MRTSGSRRSGIERSGDYLIARANKETSKEVKQEIMSRIPEDIRDAITATVQRFGPLHSLGVKWKEKRHARRSKD